MATIEEALVAVLEADIGLAAVVGDRIYPQLIPAEVDLDDDNNLPCIVYTRVSDREMVQVPVAFPQFQLTVFAKSYLTGTNTVRLLKDALHRYKGGDIVFASFQNGQDLPDPDVEGLRQWPSTFRVTHFVQAGEIPN